MIRTTAVPRPLRRAVPGPVRTGGALLGVAGVVVLAGCGAQATVAEPVVEETPAAQTVEKPEADATEQATDAGASGSVYADGTYTAEGSYATPETVETVSVTITLSGDVVTAVEVTGDPQTRESEQYQSQFIGGIAEAVVGKSVDELSVSRVAGSSLTSGGFNQALEAIKAEAAA